MNQYPEALPELDIEEFRERYPQMFCDPTVDDIYCGSGWRDILISLCDTLQSHLKRHPEVKAVAVTQVKSTSGELNFFYDGGDAYCHGAVEVATQLSMKTCSQCGAPGKQTGDAWGSTRCSEHDGRSDAKPGSQKEQQ